MKMVLLLLNITAMLLQMLLLLLLLCALCCASGDPGPEIQLIAFNDLFKLTQVQQIFWLIKFVLFTEFYFLLKKNFNLVISLSDKNIKALSNLFQNSGAKIGVESANGGLKVGFPINEKLVLLLKCKKYYMLKGSFLDSLKMKKTSSKVIENNRNVCSLLHFHENAEFCKLFRLLSTLFSQFSKRIMKNGSALHNCLAFWQNTTVKPSPDNDRKQMFDDWKPQLEGADAGEQKVREDRSLLNSYPFNQVNVLLSTFRF